MIMKEGHSYLPEDIETLLQEKAFSDLYPEEKAFVLKHVQSAEEYERLRALHQHLNANVMDLFDDPGMPDDRVRQNLLAAMQEERRKKRAFGLNNLLPSFRLNSDSWKPAMGFAFVLVIGLGTYFYFTNKEKQGGEGIVAKNDTMKNEWPQLIPTDSLTNKPELVKQAIPKNEKTEAPKRLAPNVQVKEPMQQFAVQEPVLTKDSLLAINNGNTATNLFTDIAVPVDSQSLLTLSNSLPVLTNSATSTMNYTWTSDAGALSNGLINGASIATAVFTIGPEKSRALNQDGAYLNLFYVLK
jgi:hypothetical protein